MYALICFDRPGSAPLRDANRDAHMAYLTENRERIVYAGPLKSEDGSELSNGAIIVIDAGDRDAALAFADGDPFKQAGVFESVVIRPFKQVFPAPGD